MMNVYFSSIGIRLAAQLPAPQTDTGTVDDPNAACTPILAVINIQESSDESKIPNLKRNKATGPDEIAPRLINLLGETAVSPLTSLFTSSFMDGTVPLDWTTAI